MKVTKGQPNLMKSIDASKTKAMTDKVSAKEANGSEQIDKSSQIRVSDSARQIQKAKDIASDMTVDEAKVSRLQKLIDDGKYNVDASAVADRMVDEHFMMKS